MIFKTKLEEAQHVCHWHLYSDKTSDPKGSDMALEEAERIIAENEKFKIQQ